MNADGLIEKYLEGSISDKELAGLRSLLKKDKAALRLLLDELRLSSELEEYFSPGGTVDVIGLLANEMDDVLSDEDLGNYAAAGDPEEFLRNLLKKKE